MVERVCGICLEKYNNNNIKRLICTHIFCMKCIDRSLKIKNECPICRCNNDENIMLEYIKDISLKEYENKYNKEIINFGKYKNKSFFWVYENDKKYCFWCEKTFDDKINKNKQFKDLVYYIKQKNNTFY